MKFISNPAPQRIAFDFPPGTTGTPAFRRYDNVAGFGSNANPATGAIVFELPIGFANHMQTHEIVGYTYGPSQGMFNMWVSFYSYATGPVLANPAVAYADGYLRPQVRFARRISSGNPCIILGDVGTTWYYPKVQITHSHIGFAAVTDTSLDAAKATLETSLADFDVITSPANTSSGGAGSVYDGTLVHLAGTETITGAKTFSVAPVVPDSSFAIAKTTGLQAALDAKAADSAVAHLAGAETITGVKTISVASGNGALVLTTPTNSVNDISTITFLGRALVGYDGQKVVLGDMGATKSIEFRSGSAGTTADTRLTVSSALGITGAAATNMLMQGISTFQNSGGTQAIQVKARTTANGGQSANLLEFTDAGGNVFTTFSANGTLTSLLTATFAVVEGGNSLGTAGEIRTVSSGPATSTSTSLNSGTMKFRSRYWTGTASADDDLILQAVRRSATVGDQYLSVGDDVEVTGYLNASSDVRVAGTSVGRGAKSGAAGYAQITSNSTANATSTTYVDVTGLSVTLTTVANRRYKISFAGNIFSTVAGDQGALGIREGTTTLQSFYSPSMTVANRAYGASTFAVVTPTAGSHTYVISVSRITGSGNINTTGTCSILVEDIGPA